MRRWVGVLAGVALVLGLLPAPVGAQTAGALVASGLTNPRGLAIAPDGTIYVAESGTGGPEQFNAGPPFGTGTRGTTAQITRIAPDGSKRALVVGLPSVTLGPEVIGAKSLFLSGNTLLYTVGYTLGADTPAIYGPFVGRVDLAASRAANIADIGAYERANNPDGFTVESDAYGVAQAPDGTIWVADAGGNDVFKIDTSGRLSLVGVLPGIPGGPPNPARKGAAERDAVPTGIAVGRDGTVYVSLLTGAPFTAGTAKVVKVGSGGTFADFATGLNPTVDARIGPDGNLYVVEFSAGFDLNANPPNFIANSGRVLRITPSGQIAVVASGLNFPGGVAFDAQGRMYVTVDTDNPPQAGALGRILRFDTLTPQPFTPAAPPQPAGPVPGAAPPAAPSPTPTAAPVAAAPPAQQLPGTVVPAQVPTSLPNTGSIPIELPLALGAGAVVVGLALRRRR
jgi:hypothetical protein